MPYLSATPVIDLLPGVPTVTGSSIPLTTSEVATIIARVSAEVDSALAGAGYAVPVDSSASGYAFVQEVTNYGTSWKVLRAFFPNLGGPGGDIGLASEYRDAYRAALTAIRKGEQTIIGAALDTSGQGRNLLRSYSTSNPMATAGVLPHLDMDTVY
jgi:hypothetical protein